MSRSVKSPIAKESWAEGREQPAKVNVTGTPSPTIQLQTSHNYPARVNYFLNVYRYKPWDSRSVVILKPIRRNSQILAP